jgi:hypothetical protein
VNLRVRWALYPTHTILDQHLAAASHAGVLTTLTRLSSPVTTYSFVLLLLLSIIKLFFLLLVSLKRRKKTDVSDIACFRVPLP